MIYPNLNSAGGIYLMYTLIHSTYSYGATVPLTLVSTRGTEVNELYKQYKALWASHFSACACVEGGRVFCKNT